VTSADGRRRYPLEPLARLLGVELGRIGGYQAGQPRSGLAAVAEHLGISHTMAQRLNAEGLSERQADKYAIALGHHPGAIWPDWWDADELSLEREARHPDPVAPEADDDLDDHGGRYDLAF
jgi:hypothetical protein